MELTKQEAKKKLQLHLRKHLLDVEEYIVPVRDIENSYYFFFKYSIVVSESVGNYWKFILGDQLYSELGCITIGGPIKWYVDKSNGHCFLSLGRDSIYLYEEWILKKEINNSKEFYLNMSSDKMEEDLKSAISLWQLSNVLDEYLFLSMLKITVSEVVYSKINLLRNYELLKKNRKLEQEKLIQELLLQIPYFSRRRETEQQWQLTKKILELDKESKLQLHNKWLKKKYETERKRYKPDV